MKLKDAWRICYIADKDGRVITASEGEFTSLSEGEYYDKIWILKMYQLTGHFSVKYLQMNM